MVTTFEAAVRRSGIELRDVTILAPTDDALTAAYDRRRLDELLLSGAQARALVEQHVARGALALAELLEAGELTTLAGDTLEVTRQDAMAGRSPRRASPSSVRGRATQSCHRG